MVEIKGLCAGYPGKAVLRDVDLCLPAGQITVLTGPNGCGKSTLLKALCGILPLTGGTVTLDGCSLATLSRKELAQKIAYLSQSRQVPDITAGRLVLHGRFPYLSYPRRYRPEDHAAAEAAMAEMGISDLADTPLERLSGGQRQKVYLAMALAQDTPVVLLDEPTTYLDIRHQQQLMAQAKALRGRGKTVVMVLHDLPHALKTADRLVLMDGGRIAAQGTAEEVFTSGGLDRVFGITLGRIRTESGWQYYCGED